MSVDRIDLAVRAERARALRQAVRVRAALMVVITGWVLSENAWPQGLYFVPFMAGFAVAPFLIARAFEADARQPLGWLYLMVTIDAVLLALTTLIPNPFYDNQIGPQVMLTLNNENYFYLLIVGAGFFYAPALVLFTGAVCAAAWAIGAGIIYYLPDTIRGGELPTQSYSKVELFELTSNPLYIDPGDLARPVVVMILTATVLAFVVRRARALLAEQAEAARQRTNLARYFAQNMVDELAGADDPLEAAQTQRAAVLFLDIVGFTGFADGRPADDLIATLRQFHARVSAQVFAHGGTLEKFTGDGVMATFGTPRPGPADAANALACARDMVAAADAWNAERADAPALAIGVGVALGPVVIGDVGDGERMERAVLGDTVNVAARLERLTRELDSQIAVSADLIQAAGDEGADLAGFEPAGARPLRGRAEAIDVWVYRSVTPSC
ncbi:MAG: adenylate/guanylate cyclase domain-containing protein [Alphaproteobacteria bacterium]